MSRNNMSDEELDNLFRKSAESFDPPFDDGAWAALSSKLDKVQRASWWRKGMLSFLAIALVLVSLPVMKLLFEPDTVPEIKVITRTENNSRNKEEQSRLKREDKRITAVQETEGESALSENEQVAVVPVAKDRHINRNARFESRSIHIKRGGVEKGSGLIAVDELKYNLTESGSTDAGAQPFDNLIADDNKTDAMSTLIDTANKDVVMHLHDKEVRIVADSSNHKRFSRSLRIGLLLAPDYTTVKIKNPEAVSLNAGILVGIPVTNRISLVSGAIWANKVYSARPENYTPSPDYWQGKQLPNMIDARCQVLDVPLNVQFQVLERGKNLLAVQAGLSSYIMLNEKYTYNYDYYGKTYSKIWQLDNENQHWFGVQNLAVNYTRTLSPVFSVAVEPFVKIPLSGIGAGQVKLTSAGVFFAAVYHINLKK